MQERAATLPAGQPVRESDFDQFGGACFGARAAYGRPVAPPLPATSLEEAGAVVRQLVAVEARLPDGAENAAIEADPLADSAETVVMHKVRRAVSRASARLRVGRAGRGGAVGDWKRVLAGRVCEPFEGVGKGSTGFLLEVREKLLGNRQHQAVSRRGEWRDMALCLCQCSLNRNRASRECLECFAWGPFGCLPKVPGWQFLSLPQLLAAFLLAQHSNRPSTIIIFQARMRTCVIACTLK
eukprot:1187241-Pleurochrysis_carterae.AAC.1